MKRASVPPAREASIGIEATATSCIPQAFRRAAQRGAVPTVPLPAISTEKEKSTVALAAPAEVPVPGTVCITGVIESRVGFLSYILLLIVNVGSTVWRYPVEA